MLNQLFRRRTMLRAAFLGLGITALSACTATSAGSASASPTSAPAAIESSPGSSPRVLVVYFSRAGENYWDGGRRILDVGNTQVVAEMITGLIDADVYRIEAAEPYSSEYDATVQRNQQEIQDDARPAIANPLPSLDNYDVVLLGSPVWAMQEPVIMRTFVEAENGLAGITAYPFVTYAVSGMGSVAANYERLYPDATWGEGLAVQGEEAQDARGDVEAWLEQIGLL